MEEEVWRDIDGYEGYQVSNLGNVRSLDRTVKKEDGTVRFLKGKILKQFPSNRGYLLVRLCKDGKGKTYSVHRIVAKAFIPNERNLSECNHKSEVKTDNRAQNLEWCNREYNINYGTAIQRMVKKRFNKT